MKQAILRMTALAVCSLGLPCAAVTAQAPPRVPEIDRVRIQEAFRLGAQLGDSIWPNWHLSRWSMILVLPDNQFLIGQPNAPADYTPVPGDTLLGEPVFYRARQFPTAIQATFPAVNGINTIVIGEPEQTSDKTSTRWVVTVLHEHFHQLTNSRPGYYAGVDSLGLAHGDQTGMWMLNYSFPYDSAHVQETFTTMNHALLHTLRAPSGATLAQSLDTYRRARQAFRESVPAEGARYFAFQLWQEGVARYTEWRLSELAADRYTPSADFKALPDFVAFADVEKRIRDRIFTDLESISLARSRREVVYSVGAAMAMLLDRVRPEWKVEYFAHPYRLPDE